MRGNGIVGKSRRIVPMPPGSGKNQIARGFAGDGRCATIRVVFRTLPSMSPPNSLLLAVAVQAARRASGHAASLIARRHDANSIARNDIKLKLDEECQAI